MRAWTRIRSPRGGRHRHATCRHADVGFVPLVAFSRARERAGPHVSASSTVCVGAPTRRPASNRLAGPRNARRIEQNRLLSIHDSTHGDESPGKYCSTNPTTTSGSAGPSMHAVARVCRTSTVLSRNDTPRLACGAGVLALQAGRPACKGSFRLRHRARSAAWPAAIPSDKSPRHAVRSIGGRNRRPLPPSPRARRGISRTR
jgi:hypothetical protein